MDPVNDSTLEYGYGTYNSLAGAARTKATCGARAYLGFSTERPMTSCPGSGMLMNGGYHCHIYLFDRPTVGSCFADDLSGCNMVDKPAYNDY